MRASSSDSSRAAAFDRLDRTSRMLIATVNCARSSAKARADGLFGPPDSVGRKGQCLRKNGRAFGVFFTPDSAFTKALHLRVVDIAEGVRYLGPVDTTALLAEARVAQEAVLKGFPSFQREKRQFVPFSMRSDGDSIEVWLLPLGLVVGRAPSTVGGELAYIYSPDGRILAREIDAFDRHRTLPIPDSGRVELLSREDDLPLVSELIATNRLHDQGRDVQLVTKAFAAQLVGPDPTSVWIQIRRR
ncbi:MAG TPA: hypothetical protein VK571_01960 [Gemmatimonadaceae bacterium]|nr:hypothetical protein [Gemmatimonadaceae bacterium]